MRFPGVSSKKAKVKSRNIVSFAIFLCLKTFTRLLKILSKLPLTPENERLRQANGRFKGDR